MKEIQNRIRLSVAAYAYEILDDPVMTDEAFDRISREIDVNVITGNKLLDDFFKKEFEPDTGMWIRKHPELSKLHWLYEKYYKGKVLDK